MGLLTIRNKDSETLLHRIQSRSDGSLFWGNDILFLGEVDSHKEGGDLYRMIAQAAFQVRFRNRVLRTTETCLPVFWISDQCRRVAEWSGQCYLVYEEGPFVRFPVTCFLLKIHVLIRFAITP